MNTRDDFIAKVTLRRGLPDSVEHFRGGVALHYGRAAITANDREISLNSGPHWDAMVSLRVTRERGFGK